MGAPPRVWNFITAGRKKILPNRFPCANNVHIILNGNIGQIATPGPIGYPGLN